MHYHSSSQMSTGSGPATPDGRGPALPCRSKGQMCFQWLLVWSGGGGCARRHTCTTHRTHVHTTGTCSPRKEAGHPGNSIFSSSLSPTSAGETEREGKRRLWGPCQGPEGLTLGNRHPQSGQPLPFLPQPPHPITPPLPLAPHAPQAHPSSQLCSSTWKVGCSGMLPSREKVRGLPSA